MGIVPFSINFLYFDRDDLFLPGGPIILTILMTYLIADIFLGVIQTIMSTIFVCALEDWKLHEIGKQDENVQLFASSQLKDCIAELREIKPSLVTRASIAAKENPIYDEPVYEEIRPSRVG